MKNSMDPATYQSKHEEKLKLAQKLLEESIRAFALAVDVEAEATERYRKRKLRGLAEAKEEGYASSARAEVAKLKSHEEERGMLNATGKKKECSYWIDAYRERCYNIRHFRCPVQFRDV